MRVAMRRRQRRGIVLVAVCLFLLMMVAGLGLGVDLNRLLLAQGQARAEAEAVAVAAVLELDGTPAGFERARVRAAETWRRLSPPAGARVLLEFGSSPDGPWNSDPFAASPDLRAARASVSFAIPLTLLRSVVPDRSLPVDGIARAAQVEHKEAAPALSQPLAGIVQSDTDPASPTYAEYVANDRGNGRRLVAVDGSAVFLSPDGRPAERVGGYLIGSRHRANADRGIWRTEVIR